MLISFCPAHSLSFSSKLSQAALALKTPEKFSRRLAINRKVAALSFQRYNFYDRGRMFFIANPHKINSCRRQLNFQLI